MGSKKAVKNPDKVATGAFLALLRSALYGDAVESGAVTAATPWPEVLQLARDHAVLVSVAEAITRLPEELQPDAATMSMLSKTMMMNMLHHQRLDHAVSGVFATLRGAGVLPVLLKGQGIARQYRQPEMRHCGDIDVYVGRRDFHKACETLNPGPEPPDLSFEDQMMHWVTKSPEGIKVEVHRIASTLHTPWRSRRFHRWVEATLSDAKALRRVTIGGGEVLLPPLMFDAVFIFVHAWRHFMFEGIGLRQLSDWTLLMHNHAADLDREELGRLLRRLGLLREWRTFAWIAVNRLGLEASKMPFYSPRARRRSLRAFVAILRGGNFGHVQSAFIPHRQGEAYLLRKVITLYNIAASIWQKAAFSPVETFFTNASRTRLGVRKLLRGQ